MIFKNLFLSFLILLVWSYIVLFYLLTNHLMASITILFVGYTISTIIDIYGNYH